MIEWINIFEQKPPGIGQYLIVYNPEPLFDKQGNVMRALYDNYGSWSELPACDDIESDYVTHWAHINMPEKS